jgi:hypothetical protein
MHLQYSAKSESTPHCQSLITARSNHPPVLGLSGPQRAIHPPKINTPKFKEISLLVFLQKERGVIEKKYMLKKHRKNVLQSKGIGKRENHDPLQKKARGESQSKECLEKHKNIPSTCTSRSSCMTSFILDPIFGSTTCGTSESLLSYPKLHIQAIEVGS